MVVYTIINIIIAVIACIAILYILFRLYAWRQGDAHFVVDVRRRTPFVLKEMTQTTAVWETEVTFHNIGKQLGTIMDFYPRPLLPQEQFDRCRVQARLTNLASERDDGYWEAAIYYPATSGLLRVTVILTSKTGNIREDLRTFPDMPIDLVYQAVARSEWYIHKARITLRAAEVYREIEGK
ncbi:hypothetical protein [uncultured Megasphaera sp.]|uniref:hypothetical protein n=1 Tax=uncultured Megasphaera sp. TaxID=165188 RepID=UPI00288936DA|nr:hypothetical protein [uncultured Megasphaera sp.]